MKDFIDLINKERKKMEDKKDGTSAERLRYRAFYSTKTDSEWLQLQKEIREYLETDPAETEKKIIYSFSEMVGMTCSAIKAKRR